MLRARRKQKYWTKARVVDGLRRFYHYFKVAPSSSIKVGQMAQTIQAGSHKAFPPAGTILQYFPSMYEAWAATGIEAALPHCECGKILPSFRSRSCKECASRHQSAGIRRTGGVRKYWPTPEIEAEIRRVYNETRRSSKFGRIKALAEKLGWPRWAVQKRARELGIVPRTKKVPDWIPEELALLEKYAYLIPENISKRLKQHGFNRTPMAVHVMLGRLKLRRETPFYSGNQLAQLIGEDGHVITRWAKEGFIAFTMKGTNKHGRQHGDTRLFHEVDVYIFLTSHRHLYDIRKCNQEWLLATLIDFPRKHRAGIAARQLEVAGGIPDNPPDWSGTKWKDRKELRRQARRAVSGRAQLSEGDSGESRCSA